jgi:hypothetical protein
MPVPTPTAKGYDVSGIHQGPGDLWVIATPPTDSAQRLVLASDGTPDSTTHGTCICFGLTKGGITFSATTKTTSITVDQAEAPVDKYVETVAASIEAELTQQSVDLLQNAMTTGVYATSTGYKQIAFGGISIVPTACIAAITPKRTGSGLFIVSMLYKADIEGLLTSVMARNKQSTHKVKFNGQSDLTRTSGKQIGIHYETI